MRNNKLFILIFLLVGNYIYAQTELKVMTFNVGYDEAHFHKGKAKRSYWVYRKPLQVGMIDYHNPDIIGMQEPMDNQVEYLSEKLNDYSWVGVARDDGKKSGEYCPVFYKKEKITLLDWGTFWLSETPEKVSKSWDAGYNRICTWTLFEVKETKEQFYVFNNHFDSVGEEARLQSSKLLMKKVSEISKGKPVFVIGDFNLLPEDEPYKVLTENLKDSRIATENTPYGPEGTFNNFRRKGTDERIDYIFVNDKVNVKTYSTLTDSNKGLTPSDHYPVIIKAVLK